MSRGKGFERLARPMQRVLWDMRWEQLRPIQVAAIDELLDTDRDLIISARTAAGKTEAAFLPILSLLCEDPRPSVQALYVGPLKALINDQFERLEGLCQRAEIPVHRWHGDVDAGKKNELTRRPTGVLLITPESLESMFINRTTLIPAVFRDLRFVVIDEVHAFLGKERGTQLRSLLFRLASRIGHEFRMVALSATLGNAQDLYKEYLRPGSTDTVTYLQSTDDEKGIFFRIHCYPSEQTANVNEAERDPADEEQLPSCLIDDIYTAFSKSKNLLFTNNRGTVEELADALNEKCKQHGTSPSFLVHHGSLSKEVREHTETQMQGDRALTTICSSTLELGIDIGCVSQVGQMAAPWSVNSLVQRLGRSGRGSGDPQSMRMFLIEDVLSSKSPLIHQLHPQLLQAIAATELMLGGWVEPPEPATNDLSTLTQQALSMLAETGGLPVSVLFQKLVLNGAFRAITQSVFVEVLRALKESQLVEQLSSGEVVLAPLGERLVNHFEFYSAFATEKDYAVLDASRHIGNLPLLSLPQPADHLLLAGRRWQVVQVNHERCEILVKAAAGKKPPRFNGAGGWTHTRVRAKMREVLLSKTGYPYLNGFAADCLNYAREAARLAGLHTSSFVSLSTNRCLWFTWVGTKTQWTLKAMLEESGVQAAFADYGVKELALEMDLSADEAARHVRELSSAPIDPTQLSRRLPIRQLRKFDHYLSEQLLLHALAVDFIDKEAVHSDCGQ